MEYSGLVRKENNSLPTDFSGVNEITSPSVKYLMSLQSKESRITMRYHLNKVSAMCGQGSKHQFTDWSIMNSELVMLIRSKLVDDGLAPTTINAILCAIRKTCEFLFIDKRMSAEDLKRIELVKNIKGTRLRPDRELNSSEIQTYVAYCETQGLSGLRDKTVFLLILGTGIRRSECVNIKIKDVDLDKGTILINGKGSNQRLAAPNDDILELLKEYIEETRYEATEDEYLFVGFTKNDEPKITKGGEYPKGLEKTSLNYIFSERSKKANIQPFKPHDLRRTYATKLLRDGVPLEMVQRLLGHKNFSTTVLYDLRKNEEAQEIGRNHKVL